VTGVGARTAAIAVVRIGTGFMFLWAFLDKTFGLGAMWAGIPLVKRHHRALL